MTALSNPPHDVPEEHPVTQTNADREQCGQRSIGMRCGKGVGHADRHANGFGFHWAETVESALADARAEGFRDGEATWAPVTQDLRRLEDWRCIARSNTDRWQHEQRKVFRLQEALDLARAAIEVHEATHESHAASVERLHREWRGTLPVEFGRKLAALCGYQFQQPRPTGIPDHVIDHNERYDFDARGDEGDMPATEQPRPDSGHPPAPAP